VSPVEVILGYGTAGTDVCRYSALGVHWAAALPGFIALAMIPFTVLFYKCGSSIRAKCKYAADAERQMNALIAARMAAGAGRCCERGTSTRGRR
jgi:hypothetical protein